MCIARRSMAGRAVPTLLNDQTRVEMPMPFPGMDPYLEHPILWSSVHTRLIVALANQLKPRLKPRYVASVEERVFVEGPDQQRVPDAWVQKTRPEGRGPMPVAGMATATPLIIEVDELEVREHYIDILDRYRDFRVVTVIEVVRPANKAAGPGRDSYEARRGAVPILRMSPNRDRLVATWPPRHECPRITPCTRETLRLPHLREPLAYSQAFRDLPLPPQRSPAGDRHSFGRPRLRRNLVDSNRPGAGLR